MTSHTDPATGLTYHELSHEWGHGVPSMPGYDDVLLWRTVKHAQHGVMAHRMKMVMHSGTHMNAPIHLVQRAIGIGELPLERLFGNGVIVSIPKDPWGTVTKTDLEAHAQWINAGDLVLVVTGWHRRYSDSLEYFGDAPGLSLEAAEWLVEKQIGLLGIDTPQVDHPMATSLADHRGGPQMNRVVQKYRDATGLDPEKEHPIWNGAHKVLLAAGIPTIENVGGDVDELLNTQALIHALPWKFDGGDACPVRLVAITDPSNNYQIDAGDTFDA
ncbi:MAG: cyclase family protein [Gammaproteobacteria bacterium]|nr:cyclase family protein [Gammaproteobacteria bacterium]